MPEKIIQRKCFVINTAYILIAAMLVLLTILTAGLLMPFWIALFLSAILQPIIQIVKRKTGTKKERIINNRTIPILSAAVLYPYLWYSRSYKFVWRFISKFPRLL